MDSFMISLQLIGSLLLIVFLAYVSLRLIGRRTGMVQSQGVIRLVHTQALGQNKSIHALVIDEKTVLLVGAGSQIETLARFDDEQLAQKLLAAQDRSLLGAGQALPAIVKLWMGKRRPKRARDSETGEFAALFKTRLDDLSQRRTERLSDFEPARSEEQRLAPDDDARWPE
jgi:flagellar biogenesis protein FliO